MAGPGDARPSTRRSASALPPRRPAARDLRRHAAAVRGERRGWLPASGSSAARSRASRRALVPHMGWNTLRLEGDVPAPRRARRGGRLLRPQLRRAARRRAARVPRSTTTGPSWRLSKKGALAGVQFHPERSASRGRAAPRQRAGMVKKRLIPCLGRHGRPRRQGRQVREPARHGRSDRSGDAVLRPRGGRACLPRHHGHRLRARPDRRADRARRRGAADPVHRRWRRILRWSRRGTLLRAGADKVAVNRAAVEGARLAPFSNWPRSSCAGRRLRDRLERPAKSSHTAVARRAGSTRSAWAQEAVRSRRRGDPPHSRSTPTAHASGLRPRSDARGQRGSVRSGHRLGRRLLARSTSPRRSRRAPKAALVASIVHEAPERIPSMKQELKEAGWPIRLAS